MTAILYGLKRLATPDFGHTLRLRLLDGPLDLAWKHSSMTSDFISETVALKFRASRHRYNQVRHDVGYLTNELMENAIKFRKRGEIVIDTLAEGDCFKIRVANLIDNETSSDFQGLLSRLTSGDPGELLIEHIEASAAAVTGNMSGLGLLTLMSDYQVQLAWLFEEDSLRKQTRVETSAAMSIAAI